MLMNVWRTGHIFNVYLHDMQDEPVIFMYWHNSYLSFCTFILMYVGIRISVIYTFIMEFVCGSCVMLYSILDMC